MDKLTRKKILHALYKADREFSRALEKEGFYVAGSGETMHIYLSENDAPVGFPVAKFNISWEVEK